MRVTKAQAEANRARIVETASTLFRERGYDGVGVADLMAAAGFTHGGFYKHFGSKADLMAEAAASGLSQSLANTEGMDAAAFFTSYVSREHRDGPSAGCTMAALCGDAARQSADIKATFCVGIDSQLAALTHESAVPDAVDQRDVRATMIAMLAQAVGAVVLSRSCPDGSALADEILETCRKKILAQLSPAAGGPVGGLG